MRNNINSLLFVAALIMVVSVNAFAEGSDAHPADGLAKMNLDHMAEDGTFHIPAFELPMSRGLSNESKTAAIKMARAFPEFASILAKDCPISLGEAKPQELAEIRECRANAFKKTFWHKDAKARFPAKMISQDIGGVRTDIYTPLKGVAPKNEHRILIHLHGGGMQYGAYWQGQISAAPIAVEGGYKVISVDYRQWPEANHPAAMEDVLAVYRELLKDYRAENVGIYGCSAGGYFSGQSIAWIDSKGLPLPGAVGMFGGAISSASDSGFLGTAVEGNPVLVKNHVVKDSIDVGYLAGSRLSDKLVLPGDHPDVLAKYPPSLLITSTRDGGMSSTVATHSNLIKAGVDADLHVWEGLGHCFTEYPFVPEAGDARRVTLKFFDKHLGVVPL